MRQLLPLPADGPPPDVDPARVYATDARPAPTGRPWLAVTMVASLDGAISLDGRSGGLGGPADRRVFGVLRGLADVVLVGAGTVRTEGYGPVSLPEPVQAARIERGQAPVPRLAIVSRSLQLDLDAPLFTDSDPPPLVVTSPATSTARRSEIADRADLLLAGHGDRVDVTRAVVALGELGARLVLAEGGPSLNGQLHDAGLVDEVCLTVAPLLAGGDAPRLCIGPHPPVASELELRRVLEEDGSLFLRYARVT